MVVLASLAALQTLPSWMAAGVRAVTVCPFSVITGTPCPLCGTTEAFVFLLRGEWAASLRANPLALALTPTLLIQPLYRAARVVRPAVRWREEVLIATVCILGGIAVFAPLGSVRW
jgi:hypothetical protein